MYSLWNSKNIYKAVFFATHAFNKEFQVYDENRKSYTAHFTSVAFNAINFSIQDDINREFLLTVAILHDVLEDTSVSYKQLEEEFGVEVAKAVKALSRNEDIPFDEQIPDCLNRIKQQPKEVAIVKMADRLYNIRERYNAWDFQRQEKYKKEAQLVCDELGYASENMRLALQKAIDEY